MTKIDLYKYGEQGQEDKTDDLVEGEELPDIQISGNNVDGFVITYAQ